MHEKLGDRTINPVYFRLCEPFQVGALVGSLYYVLDRENLSSRCPLPPWPGRTIMFLRKRICRHDVPYHPGWVVLLCSCAREFFVSMPLTTLAGSYYYVLVREFFVTMSLTTLAGSYNYVLVRENLSSRCPLPHQQIYLNCHFEKIQSYLNIHVSS